MSSAHCFSTNPLDRAQAQRRDPNWVRAQLDHPDSRFLPFWKLNVLLKNDPVGPAWARSGLCAKMDAEVGAVLLGVREGVSHFAVDISPLEEPVAALGLEGRADFQDLRMSASVLDADDAGIVAQARSLIDWHASHQFCPRCGGGTRSEAGGAHRVCIKCETEHFPRVSPVAIVLVARGDRCLLGRQKAWPAGFYSTLAGFVEPGESLEQTAQREVAEESGVEIGNVRYHSSQAWPFPSSLMMGCVAEALTEDISVDKEELEDARWFDRSEILGAMKHATGGYQDSMDAAAAGATLLLPPPFAIAHHLIKSWAQGSF